MPVETTLVLMLRLLFASFLLLAGILKIRSRDQFRNTLLELGIPKRIVALPAWGIPFVEGLVAVGLLSTGVAARVSAAILFALTVAFTVTIALNLRRPVRPSCSCFGSLSPHPLSVRDLIRAILAAFGSLSMLVQRSNEFVPVFESASLSKVALYGFSVALIIAVILDGLQRELRWANFRETTSRMMNELRTLPAGAIAPSFSLEELAGETVTLDDLCGAGSPVALVFVHSTCATCVALKSVLEEYAERLQGLVRIVLIGGGSASENRSAFGTKLKFLLQTEVNVTRLYGFLKTPSAVLVNSDRTIRGEPAHGPDEIKTLLRSLAKESHSQLCT